MHNFEQSAGNQEIFLDEKDISVGTSETKRSPSYLLNYVEDIVRVINYSLIYSYILNYTVNRYYSIYINKLLGEDNKNNLNPEKVYNSLKENRVNILKQERGKSGVYCLINKINAHTYIGSSINIASRMRNYLNNSFLKSKQNINMPIVK